VPDLASRVPGPGLRRLSADIEAAQPLLPDKRRNRHRAPRQTLSHIPEANQRQSARAREAPGMILDPPGEDPSIPAA